MRVLALAALGLWLLSAVLDCAQARTPGQPIQVVAAESTYGTIAQAIGGAYVQVNSIIRNPNVDPHQFEASPQTARAVARAAVVLMNGLGYDDWMRKMLAASPAAGRVVIVAADLDPPLVSARNNPHIFYDPRVGLAVARRLSAVLSAADPAHAAAFARNLAAFSATLQPVDAAIAQLRAQHPALAVTATEPVYDYMLQLLGWTSQGRTFQFNVMNDTEPAPAVVARFEDALRQRRVALLIYNRQVTAPLTQRMLEVARASAVPTVGVDEFAPADVGYAQWLLRSLRDVQAALAERAR